MTSILGFPILIGTVVNNGILYVDTVNQYRMTMDLRTALVEAGATRLRPILMTSSTTILSMIPMVLSTGSSASTDKRSRDRKHWRSDGWYSCRAVHSSCLLCDHEWQEGEEGAGYLKVQMGSAQGKFVDRVF